MRKILGGLLLLACAGCATAPPPLPDPAMQMTALEQRILDIVSAQRRQIDPKAKDLVLDSELVDVARERSTDMAAKDAFADGSGDPHISATRLMAADAKFQGLLGENVAAIHYTKALGIDVDRSAQMIVSSWLTSPSHKENLAFADYQLTGVGAALSPDTIFVTQLFATQLASTGPRKTSQTPDVKSFTSASAAKAEATSAAAQGSPDLRGTYGTH